MFSGDISESINRFLKHGHNEHSNRGGGGRGGLSGGGGGRGVGLSVVGHPQGGQFASTVYFEVSWVVHGGPRSQVPCSGRDAMEVRRGQGGLS